MGGARVEAMEDMVVVVTMVAEEHRMEEVAGHMEAEGMVVGVKPTEEEVMGAAVEITMEEDMGVEADIKMEETMAEIMWVTMETMVEIVVKNRK